MSCKVGRASRAQRTRQVNTPRVRRAFVENFSYAPRAQDNLSKLLTTLSAIAAPSAGTLQKFMHIFGKGVVTAVRETNQSLVSLPAFTALLFTRVR